MKRGAVSAKSKVCLVSLGCSKNLVDSEVMLGILKGRGFELTTSEADADVLVVNTCGFIGDAKKESIDEILRLAEYKKTGQCRTLVVAGCLTQRYKEALAAELPEVDFFIGTGEYPRIAEIITSINFKGVYAGVPTFIHDSRTPRIVSTPGYSAYVKVAEGCNNLCSYCVIPEIRGAMRSRPVASILNEARELAGAGVKEINLIAQDTTSYGRDMGGGGDGGKGLPGLLKKLVKVDGIEWIRLLYLYPTRVSDGLIGLIRDEEKVCKYIDMPVQHVNSRILRAMNRPYTGNDVMALVERFRRDIAGVTIRTSLIAGFPGETAGEFRELLSFVKDAAFDRLGAFKYSREEGTPAFGMKAQVPERIKEARLKKIMEAQQGISLRRNKALAGETVRVLVQGRGEGGVLVGRYEGQAPEVDGVTFVNNGGALRPGDMIDAFVTGADA
ncbi:MAG: 30S ribosomal protein S12 methylthiotransferase RimO, partial [Deltaproteobacteria bacterium]|nr:30S ribosomal protein S12 methylthiotransferase RimO [Deltaproteobacteria bacterium]